ncbi:restriction endonuclease subunit S [Prevotella sp.]|uniref:restriction endonuclease subunit S n=1 Tax=Prevotella sp. TaxID=59823 RepID=UPI003AB71957
MDSAEREGLRPKGNVPNLRFPEFHGEWEKCRLGNIANVTGGYAFKSDTLNSIGGKYQVVKMGNLYQNQLDLHRSPSYTNILTSKAENVILRKGDIAITLTGTNNKRDFGYTYIFNDEKNLLLNQRCGLIRTKGDPYFLSCLLKTYAFLNQFFESATGGTGNQANVSTKAMEMFSVNTPSLKEQKKIGVLMALLDERIATQNKIIDKLQSLIKGLNDFLYTQYGGEVLTSFAELGTSYSGLSGKSAQDFGSGKPFITYLNVYSNNVIKENDFQYVAIKDDEKQNVVKYGDVLLTLSSETPEEVGVGSVYLGKEKVYLNSFCFGIHITNTEVAFPPYLSYYVSLTAFRKFIYPYAQGSTRFNLCKADFEKASIKLPTLENQKRIYSILSHIDNKIITERQMLDLYNSQKQYLLRQMFI